MDDATSLPSRRAIFQECGANAAARSSPEFDADKYGPYVAGLDLTADQKRELLRALWDMMVMFADLEFGTEATQLACGQISESEDSGAIQSESPVK